MHPRTVLVSLPQGRRRAVLSPSETCDGQPPPSGQEVAGWTRKDASIGCSTRRRWPRGGCGRLCRLNFRELFPLSAAGSTARDSTGDLSAEQIWAGAERAVERLTESSLRKQPAVLARGRALWTPSCPNCPSRTCVRQGDPGWHLVPCRVTNQALNSVTERSAAVQRRTKHCSARYARRMSTASRTRGPSAGRGRPPPLDDQSGNHHRYPGLTSELPQTIFSAPPFPARRARKRPELELLLDEPFEGGIKNPRRRRLLRLRTASGPNPNIRLTVACKDAAGSACSAVGDLQQHKQQQGRANTSSQGSSRQRSSSSSSRQGVVHFSALVSPLVSAACSSKAGSVQQTASPARNQPTAEHESPAPAELPASRMGLAVPAIDFQVYGTPAAPPWFRFPKRLRVTSSMPKPASRQPRPPRTTAEAAAAAECRGQRVPHEIRIASVTPQALAAMAEQPPESQPSTEPKPPALSAAPSAAIERAFFSGNPSAGLTHGMLHLMKDTGDWGSARPSVLFVADSGSELLEMKIIRDRSPGQFMVLLQFHRPGRRGPVLQRQARRAVQLAGAELTCCLAYVARVETRSRGAQFPVRELVELPTCPVCLDRLDEPLKGILTILCNHSFHLRCLDKCTRPLPRSSDGNSCSLCGDTDSLWICLICGYVGCGRYTGGHAYEHFRSTSHTFAMEGWCVLSPTLNATGKRNSSRWARTGSGTTAATTSSTGWCRTRPDGKLVQVGGDVPDDKLDAVTLEYTYLLTSQLESQRLYYEEQLEQQAANLRETALQAEQEREQRLRTMAELEEARRERAALDKRLARRTAGCRSCRRSWTKSAAFNSGMLANQRDLQERLQAEEARRVAELRKKEEELEQLREEMRDLYAHLEAGQQLAGQLTQDEAVGSQLVVGEQPQQGASGSKSAKKRSGR
uniref:UBP-type domain-containing protein n=1 Tax=Macrostomum lignano TaxID=282301 RepID=A0A1I8JNH4_9PLAT